MNQENKENAKQPRLWQAKDTVYCATEQDHKKALMEGLKREFGGKEVQMDFEYSGSGVYRLQAWLDRPEGIPLVSLKWESV